jgi:hypothetical protein
VAIDPGLRGLRELALFAMVHCFNWIAEIVAGSGFHFYKRDEIFALRDEINVASARAESARENSPAGLFEVAGGDALAEFPEGVRGFGHVCMVRAAAPACIIENAAGDSEKLRLSADGTWCDSLPAN